MHCSEVNPPPPPQKDSFIKKTTSPASQCHEFPDEGPAPWRNFVNFATKDHLQEKTMTACTTVQWIFWQKTSFLKNTLSHTPWCHEFPDKRMASWKNIIAPHCSACRLAHCQTRAGPVRSTEKLTCSMEYSFPATSATLEMTAMWSWSFISRHLAKVRLALGRIGKPSSSESWNRQGIVCKHHSTLTTTIYLYISFILGDFITMMMMMMMMMTMMSNAFLLFLLVRVLHIKAETGRESSVSTTAL